VKSSGMRRVPTIAELREQLYVTQGRGGPGRAARVIRSHPRLYSMVRRARLLLSRYLANTSRVLEYGRHPQWFAMSEFEAHHVRKLCETGVTLLQEFFDGGVVESIERQADRLFRRLEIDVHNSYSVFNGLLDSLEGFSYDEIRSFEGVIGLKDPLVLIPDAVNVVFNETILRITANYLRYIPRSGRVVLLRNFPHDEPLHASNFHTDSDYDEVVQIFVYLVDVDGHRGPFLFVPGSHTGDARACSPRSNADLGRPDSYLRISDEEIAKYYPRSEWQSMKARRGSVVIANTNGFHKGPVWERWGDPGNGYRDVINFSQRSLSVGVLRDDIARMVLGQRAAPKGFGMSAKDSDRLSVFQRRFARDAETVQ